MDPYSTDAETVEQLRAWWRENGLWIIGGIALGAAVLLGWRWWSEWREDILTRASDTYRQVVVEADNGDHVNALGLAESLRETRWPTPYADLAALYLARSASAQGDLDAAREQLRRVIDSSRDDETVQLARVRLARVLLAAGALDEAAALVDGAEAGRYAPLFAELRGDLAVARGDTDAAAAAYRDALSAPADGVVDRALIEMKLDDLGASAPAQGA